MALTQIGFAARLSADPRNGEVEPQWVDTPASSWVTRYRYFHPTDFPRLLAPGAGIIQIQYHDKQGMDTVCCEYENVPPATALDFGQLASKGKAVHKIFYHGWRYTIVA